jgi:hypothetical protein
MSIQERIDIFKSDIQENKLTSEEIFQKHFVDGTTYFFHEYLRNPAQEYLVKTIISKALSAPIREIIIIGSGKLGFSLKPANLFNEFDSLYLKTRLNKDKSDIDIAVVSSELYSKIGRSLYGFTSAYTEKWELNEYYPRTTKPIFPVPICYKYFEYFTKGWFRPDFKPQGFEFCLEGSYEELKGNIYRRTNRKIALAIYQNWFYFMDYHIKNIERLKLRLKTTIL